MKMLLALAVFCLPGLAMALDAAQPLPKPDATCGDIQFFGYRSEMLDGNSRYVRASTGETISTCGGVCRGVTNECEGKCPPPEWKCEAPQVLLDRAGIQGSNR